MTGERQLNRIVAASLAVVLGIGAMAPAISAEATAAKEAPASAERRLESARQRLEAAAQEVAELSMQAAGGAGERVFMFEQRMPRAIIGVQIDPEVSGDGAKVARVSPNGPAEQAGVRVGDVITEIEGKSLKGRDKGGRALVEHMSQVEAERKLRVTLLREGKPRDVVIVARAAPAPSFAAFSPATQLVLPGPEGPGAMRWRMHAEGGIADMELVSLSPGLGAYFGTERGVLVVRAPKDATWKLADGDVLLAIDSREPTSGSHATRILRSYQGGEKIRLKVLRQRGTLEFDIVVPQADKAAGAGRMPAPCNSPTSTSNCLPS